MSHYIGYNTPVPQIPNARVVLIGGSLIVTGLLGFYAYLKRTYARKRLLDSTDNAGLVSSWESRMLEPSEQAAQPAERSPPLPAAKSEHDAHHRTSAEDHARLSPLGLERVLDAPTVRRMGADVYTRSPAWREAAHTGVTLGDAAGWDLKARLEHAAAAREAGDLRAT